MIASFIEGRVRVRDAALKNAENAALILNVIQAQKGVLECSVNPRTGSLLVLYDPERLSRESMLQALEMLEAHSEKKKRGCSRPLSSRQESLLLGASLGLTLLGGVTSRQVHVAAGIIFSLLSVSHVWIRRRCLF